MQLLLEDQAGRMFEAILLAASRRSLRVAVKDFEDAVELVYSYGWWRTKEGRPLELGSIINDGVLVQELCDCLAQTVTATL